MKVKSQTYAVIHNASGEVVETTITRDMARQVKRNCEYFNPGVKFSIMQYTVSKKVR